MPNDEKAILILYPILRHFLYKYCTRQFFYKYFLMGPTSLPYIFFSMWQVLLLIELKPFFGWTFQIMNLIVLTCSGRVSFLGFRFRGSRVLPRNRLLRTRRQSGTRTCPWSRPSHRKSGSNQASRCLKRIFIILII